MGTVVEFPLNACGLEMRIAHRRSISGCEPINFPNQRLRVYVESQSYIRGNEFIAAKLVGPHPIWEFSVELKMRKGAIKKLNALAGRADLPKLGVFKRGIPVLLIQGIHRIPGDVLSWSGFKSEESAHSMLEALLD